MFYLRIIDAGWLESFLLCVIVIVRKRTEENGKEKKKPWKEADGGGL